MHTDTPKTQSRLQSISRESFWQRHALCVELDHWIHRHLRMAYWRQWRLVRTKIGKLINMGVNIETADACGRTRKVPCHSSKTPSIQQALSNA